MVADWGHHVKVHRGQGEQTGEGACSLSECELAQVRVNFGMGDTKSAQIGRLPSVSLACATLGPNFICNKVEVTEKPAHALLLGRLLSLLRLVLHGYNLQDLRPGPGYARVVP